MFWPQMVQEYVTGESGESARCMNRFIFSVKKFPEIKGENVHFKRFIANLKLWSTAPNQEKSICHKHYGCTVYTLTAWSKKDFTPDEGKMCKQVQVFI